MGDRTLLMMASEVRGKTLRLLEGVSDEDARWAPAGTHNHILWNAGHALVVVEHLSVATASGQKPQLPEGFFEKFSWSSKPATVSQWPRLSEVVTLLQEQLGRLRSAIEAVDEEELQKETGDAQRRRSARFFIVHGLHDEANHQGEIHLLKKLLAQRVR